MIGPIPTSDDSGTLDDKKKEAIDFGLFFGGFLEEVGNWLLIKKQAKPTSYGNVKQLNNKHD